MKKVLSLLFVAFAMISLISCSSDKPEDAAKNFFENMNSGNFTEAKKYCDKTTGQMLDMVITMSGGEEKIKEKLKEEKKKKEEFIFVKTELKGKNKDEAVVYYKTTANAKESTLQLKKIDGEWKVSMSKEEKEKNKDTMS
ncbi:DUF4878 domain-containing protein [Riemerella columbipharyngis]|uniref:DUF4878 domain-containing protein n=1 Tax=Riemerella columbipharyngis TaxID=1071918 RepID=A0A1G6YS99_9FLAO|nr:DUF4878 domain-containing protein [Riemerella columbipharyngis]SDD92537.1 protein of unknown function [Riemerella columbipharyngis]